jgi:hypothetical protein
MTTITAGTRVRFQASLSDGGQAKWTAIVVRVSDGIASVRHPKSARKFPFSPVPADALYRYRVGTLRAAR